MTQLREPNEIERDDEMDSLSERYDVSFSVTTGVITITDGVTEFCININEGVTLTSGVAALHLTMKEITALFDYVTD